MKVKSISHLQELCKGREQLDCYVLLNGYCRSSKTFILNDDTIVVCNEIDGTTQDFDDWEELNDVKKTIIGEAIEKGRFFVYDYEVEK
jgi:hypothetical protein